MFSLGSSHSYYLYNEPTDMRKSFDSLSGLVRSQMDKDPFSGSVYVFINKQRNRIKLLHWEGGGFTLYYKRLEKGQFELPDQRPGKHAQVNWSDLILIVEGIQLKSVRRSVHFSFKK
ncbi:IS66 family insertion sequence element accessory protein TnpB [Marinoscillum furvescens]|uniref:IS66 Orf2 like protein n=1 Tax=Marinoscillum furvescens DSM 4134 TaxID=1122208 RepID=A0A3D9L9P8_MARFU|nr:IS66 family insertion sequence element accessory protein TnpB [Marinoscillum furvescens]REE01792.1 IS66 Orf2 like protein [Marinoscillum furvescens DSM 4134]